MRTIFVVAALLTAGALSGCGALTPVKVVGDPSEVTVEQALKSVGDGLRDMRVAIGENKTGLIPAEVTINFKLAASATANGKLTVDLSVPLTSAGAAGSGKVGASAEQTSAGSRSNEISIRFVNLLLVPKETLATIRSAAEIDALIKALKENDITTYVAPVLIPK